MAQYGVSLSTGPYDYNSNIHVGWSSTGKEFKSYNDLFKQETINYISKTVTKYLRKMTKQAIVVCDEQIRQMITSVWNTEAGGDTANIYTKDTFDLNKQASYTRIIQIVIESITSQIKNQYEMEQCNNDLDIWVQLYGDFNKAGLRQHPKIKLRERHPQYMMFNMNY